MGKAKLMKNEPGNKPLGCLELVLKFEVLTVFGVGGRGGCLRVLFNRLARFTGFKSRSSWTPKTTLKSQR